MTLVQLQFDSKLQPPSVIGQWWKNYGMGAGMKLPNPLAATEGSTCGGYESNLWVNLELWGKPDSKETIARLSAQTEPFGDAQARAILETVVAKLQPPPPKPLPVLALDPNSFTWVGGWDWTTEHSDPGQWGTQKIDEVLATAPRGFCAGDGSLIADATKTIDFGFIDSARGVAYLGYSFLGMNRDEHEVEVVEGCGSVPLSSIPGVRVLKNSTVTVANISSDGTTLAVLEEGGAKEYAPGDYGSDGYISLIDVATGNCRRLGCVDHAGGSQISFSPDDRWILVPCAYSRAGALVMDARSGHYRFFPTINKASCWWVRDGRLGLLSFGQGDEDIDPYTVTFFDLTTGETEVVVTLHDDRGSLQDTFESYYRAEPFGDGHVLLSRWLPSVRPGYNADGPYLGIADLTTGDVRGVVEPYADPDHYIERKQKNWHWNSPLTLAFTEEPTLLAEGLQAPSTSDWPEVDEYDYGALLQVSLDSPLFTGQM